MNRTLVLSLLFVAFGAFGQATPAAQLGFGGFHSCAVNSQGNLKCWGDNAYGQLGDGSSAQRRSTPRDVPGLATGVAAVAMGYQHSCALTTAGAVRCWGDNASGQLGDGTTTQRTTPVNVSGLSSGVVAIAAGGYHTCAITALGGLRCWGGNTHGQLGMGDSSFSTTPQRLTPVDVTTFGTGTRAVSLGGHHTCAIKTDSTVWCWGENWARQLGTPTVTPPTDVPRNVGITATQLSMGWEHSCARTPAGGLKCWGLNDRGQLGNGPVGDAKTGPVDVLGLTSGVAMVASGAYHTCAALSAGAAACWGSNIFGPRGMLGDGNLVDRAVARVVPGLGSRVASVAAGWGNSGAIAVDGTAIAWGRNGDGGVGDGTFVERLFARLVTDSDGVGFLDLTPENAQLVPDNLKPVFPVNTSASVSGAAVTASAQIRFRAQDVGRTANLYVFAWAPRGRVIKSSGPVLKDDPPCVMAQLNSSGQLVETSASAMQAYTNAVLSASGATVNMLNAVSAAAVTGTTVFVGYGSTGTEMAANGTSRSAYNGPGTTECGPVPPQTGWWWNPAEPGRGYSLEMSGDRLWGASYLYDTSGRSSWFVFGGPTQFEGAVYQGPLIAASGGQTLTGAYKPITSSSPGAITLAFSSATRGVITWPSGTTTPIERFNIVPGGLTSPSQADVPESGWWWNAAESGRGFFIEWQNGSATMAGYMYNEAGQPIWYITVSATPDPLRYSGTWLEFTNAAVTNPNVGPATIQFTSPTTATMTLPGGRTIPLTRYAF
ncbi:RCC1 domain-containing protein [Usitatibacter palustris]|uniref:Alpha-tubulin suppressor n=1 Tax=Usitatibacter palustris TaxID=2732487 RepID=A0A6M4H4Z2_9PROT|nr:hypothetical protein [Usitatibacter palustris]QJR14342.1 hypothetical protein DSM104440_01138 [Usitatibacter palustris]